MKKRRTPQPKSFSTYLGSTEERDRRVAALRQLAERVGAENPSELLKMLADGELTVTPAPDQRRTRTA